MKKRKDRLKEERMTRLKKYTSDLWDNINNTIFM